MKLIDLNVVDFINKVDENSPTPGGGSVSALASSLGVALAKMVQHLTISKKKYLELNEEVRSSYEASMNHLTEIKNQFIELIDKDANAYDLVMSSFKLPKTTDEEIKERNEKIQASTLEAIYVPFQVVTLSLETLKVLKEIMPYGNKNAVSDLGVAALLLQAGLEGANLNVLINLPGLDDLSLRDYYKAQCSVALTESNLIKQEIMTYVQSTIE